MEHANRGDDFIVGRSGFLEASPFETAGGAVGGGEARLGGLDGVAALAGSLLFGAALPLAAYGERGVEADRVHPASTGTGECGSGAARGGAARRVRPTRPVPVPCRHSYMSITGRDLICFSCAIQCSNQVFSI